MRFYYVVFYEPKRGPNWTIGYAYDDEVGFPALDLYNVLCKVLGTDKVTILTRLRISETLALQLKKVLENNAGAFQDSELP